MSRDRFMIVTLLSGPIYTGLFMIGGMLKNKTCILLGLVLMSVTMLHLAYFMIVRKSYNLLSGMTDERAVEISKDPVLHAKYERYAVLSGWLIIVILVVVVYFMYTTIL